MGSPMLTQPLIPSFWRVPTDNDEGGGAASYAARWRKAGLENYTIKVKDIKTEPGKGMISIMVNSVLEFIGGSMDISIQYVFNATGQTDISYQTKLLSKFPPLARAGLEFAMPADFNQIAWFGRGPFESYEDRKESADIGLYHGSVAEQYFPYVMPQENGNKTDVDWFKLTSLTRGLKIVCHTPLNINVQDYSQKALNDSKTSHTLQRGDQTYVHIDYQQMGLGGDDSWSPRVHPEYQLNADNYSFGFTLMPF